MMLQIIAATAGPSQEDHAVCPRHQIAIAEPFLACVCGSASLNCFLVAMLRAGGLRVLEVGDGIAAPAVIKRSECVGIVTTPDTGEISGSELLSRAKRFDPSIPVFVVVERQLTVEEMNSLSIADRVFQRPIKGSVLVAAIRGRLGLT